MLHLRQPCSFYIPQMLLLRRALPNDLSSLRRNYICRLRTRNDGELNDKRYWSDLFDANECIARRRYVSVTKTGKLSRSKWHTWVPCLFQGCLKLISQSYVNTVVVKSNLSTVWERPWLECYCWLLHNVKSFVSTFLRNLPDLKFAIVAL